MALPVPAVHELAVIAHAQGTGAAADAARIELVTRYTPLICSTARYFAYARPDLYPDLQQAGSVGLLLAIGHFDASYGVGLAAYAPRWVRGEARKVFDETLHADKVAEKCLDLASPDEIAADDPNVEGAELVELRTAVRGFMATLTPRQRLVAESVWLHDRSQAEVARCLGVSRARVNQILQEVAAYGREVLQAFNPATARA